MMHHEKTFDTGELTLNYIENPAAKPPLVLLHGLTGNKFGMASLIPGLASDWHIYALDFRGHGKSDRAPDDQYHNADYARDVIAFLKHLGEPAVLIGHSLGAMVSIVTAARYPAGVSRVVLLDPPLYTYKGSTRLQPAAVQWFSMVAAVMKDTPPLETVVTRLRAAMPDIPDQEIRGMASFISGVASGAPETALRDEIWQGVDLPQALGQINCPTLLIHGDWDAGAAVRGEDVAFFKANCPAAVVVHLPETDHSLKILDQPEIVLQHIQPFLVATSA